MLPAGASYQSVYKALICLWKFCKHQLEVLTVNEMAYAQRCHSDICCHSGICLVAKTCSFKTRNKLVITQLSVQLPINYLKN